MDFLKALFESGALTWEQFSAAVTEKGYKVADLSTGNYVSKAKHEDELKVKDTTIQDLNTQITTRDTDLNDLKTKLSNVDTDNKTKVQELTNQIEKLQGDYTNVKTDYESKLSTQAYEFAVKEYANTKQFTSTAAKRDFINEMIKEKLTLKDNQLKGVDDFVKSYSEANADAFKPETPPEPEVPPAPEVPKPNFIQPTVPTPPIQENAFIDAFQFAGVRPKEN